MVSESQKRATKNFEERAYFKTLVRFKKEDEARIRAAAGDSLNGFIVKCVLNAIDGQSTQNAVPINPDPIMDSLVAGRKAAGNRGGEEKGARSCDGRGREGRDRSRSEDGSGGAISY